MLRCDLLDVIFATRHVFETYDYYAFSNIIRQANLQLPLGLNVQKLKMFQFQRAKPPDP